MIIDKSWLILITFFFEVIELFLFYSDTLKKTLLKLLSYYKKSIFYFFFLHFGYLWLLFLVLFMHNFHWALMVAIIFKSFDILTQIELIKKLQQANMGSEMKALLEMKMPFWALLIGPLTYPYLVYIAFS